MLSDEDGLALIRLARRAVERYLNDGSTIEVDETIRSRYSMKAGVFVTLHERMDSRAMHGKSVFIDYSRVRVKGGAMYEELRGCIGFPLPSKELYASVVDAAIAAATSDPRFEPVKASELDRITFELSVLTEPELIAGSPMEYKHRIKVGRDGLMIVWRYGSGLLLPQVAVEYGWDEERFLCEACMKAGALPDCWLYPDTRVYRFEAMVFKEVEPHGPVVRLILQE
ncbi:MAG: TIGR00296 family protein [Candidatus Nitrosocaldus sp.]|nr:TIGR00296 family protein [Candidatus Nitrosocaldus sp.]MDW7999768.1 TIGR00296 family protein [Candidatus Nitrosocaldus sp.]